MHQSIEKALEESGLSGRDVTPFMRLSVVGLTTSTGQGKRYQRKGLITIWNPTEQQVMSSVSSHAKTDLSLSQSCSPFCLLFLISVIFETLTNSQVDLFCAVAEIRAG